MSTDARTRRHCDRRPLNCDEVFESLIPAALDSHGELAARGVEYKQLPPLSFDVEGRVASLVDRNGRLELEEGTLPGAVMASLNEGALSDLVQDWTTTMGLAMKSRARLTQGEFGDWVGWEPILRALFDGRPVHEAGAIDFKDRDERPLEIDRSFRLDDDHEEIAHFLSQAGYLHIQDVFSPEEMAAVSTDLDDALLRARPEDGASWWAGNAEGDQQAVRILFFQEQSEALRTLLADERLQWLGGLTGDRYRSVSTGAPLEAEGLVKPLDIKTGLSDLPWHKDCGQGGHSYRCSGLTVGISVTGADAQSGALGVVPGSHRANVQTSGKDDSLDMSSLKLTTRTGDLTVHCSDTLHRAHKPTSQPRQVVYTSFQLDLKPGDTVEEVSLEATRSARARLTNAQDRIAAAGAGAESSEFVDLRDEAH